VNEEKKEKKMNFENNKTNLNPKRNLQNARRQKMNTKRIVVTGLVALAAIAAGCSHRGGVTGPNNSNDNGLEVKTTPETNIVVASVSSPMPIYYPEIGKEAEPGQTHETTLRGILGKTKGNCYFLTSGKDIYALELPISVGPWALGSLVEVIGHSSSLVDSPCDMGSLFIVTDITFLALPPTPVDR
jgi:hypothetical protein